MKDFSHALPKSVDWVSGGAMLFDVEKIKQTGLFDENIFLFSEETDLCERTIKAGYSIRLCSDVFFEHLAGQSCPPSEKTEYMRWWHFGWSQCYRIVKNEHGTLFRNPQTKYAGYLIHSFTATSKAKRMKWKAKSDGALAYIRGEKAFRADGSPQFS
jgi:GT2 family glycosyltransferase